MRILWHCVIYTIAVGIVQHASAQELDSRASVSELIEKLACHMPPPVIPGRGSLGPQFQSLESRNEYVHEFQRVYAAIDELIAKGDLAFAELLAHLDDSRYSVTEQKLISELWSNLTVGQVCYRIITHEVCVYSSLRFPFTTIPSPIRYWAVVTDDGKVSPSDWWNNNKDRGLWAIQLDGIEWALREEPPDTLTKKKKQKGLLKAWADAKERLAATKKPLNAVFSLPEQRLRHAKSRSKG